MNVSCTSCSARYAVPDEKVRGKKVKITCKHCGTGIIVDGTKLDAGGGGASTSLVPSPAAAASTSLVPSPAAAASTSLVPSPAAAAPVAVAAPTAAAGAPEPEAVVPAAPAVASAAVAAAPSNAAVAPTATAPAGETLHFDIAYPDDRQETLSVPEIVEKYAAGTLDDEAFLWREGMADWRAPFDVPEVAKALTARGLSEKGRAVAPAAAGGSPFIDDDESTRVQSSPFDDPSSSSVGEWREPGKEAPSSPEAAAFDLQARSPLPFEQPAVVSPEPAAVDPKPVAFSPKPAGVSPKPAAVSPKPEASKPTAARRSAARGGGDLFGDLAAAGSEEDESLGVDAKDAQPKMTGARNESSVLFSLDALVKQEQKPAAKTSRKKEDDAAAILLGTDSGPSSLANIGTGSFGAALAAPDFTAPVSAPLPEVRASDPANLPTDQPKNKGGMGLLIGLVVVVLLAGGAFALGLPGKLAGTPAPTPSAAPTPAAAKPEAVPTTPAMTEPSAAPAPDAALSATPAPVTAVGGASAVAKPADPAKQADSTKAADEPVKPADKPADKPAEPAAASDAPPFDKAAAIAALSAAAANAGSCKTPDGPTGGGKVSITFMPSGRATNTQVSGDLAGTAVGGCVARLFRSAKVPAFSGDAVTVSKSFSVQ
jgi:predicted Zn finger-like uncharacterized protein